MSSNGAREFSVIARTVKRAAKDAQEYCEELAGDVLPEGNRSPDEVVEIAAEDAESLFNKAGVGFLKDLYLIIFCSIVEQFVAMLSDDDDGSDDD